MKYPCKLSWENLPENKRMVFAGKEDFINAILFSGYTWLSRIFFVKNLLLRYIACGSM